MITLNDAQPQASALAISGSRIVAIGDDMGYSDITPFGGEIPTPNLQAMAENGVRMSQYYTSPMSAPARAML
ncbi:sulfatase-like hydrolase/transferase, partial [Salmonella enterica subsp. enterica serovar Anatum]|nr:sulfatase-like hydrolase/transferase [Salmonella enterica subsp. enterica serovar Anatum]